MSRQINEQKRAEMKALLERLFKLGVNNNQIAERCGVGPGAVRVWARGNSMGTNAQRADLAKWLGELETTLGGNPIGPMEFKQRFDTELQKVFGLSVNDAGISMESIARWHADGDMTPEECAQWYGEKYDLTPIADFGPDDYAEMFEVMREHAPDLVEKYAPQIEKLTGRKPKLGGGAR